MYEFRINDLWGFGRPVVEHTIRLQRRHDAKMGRWNLVTEQGRIVAWVVRNSDGKTWDTRICNAAFRGTGPDDEGHVLDQVDPHLTREREPGRHDAIGFGDRTLEDAAYTAAWYLLKHRSPAVTAFGAHPSVVTWASKYPKVAAAAATF